MTTLPETFDHVHNAEACFPCNRPDCGHLTCEHHSDEDECEATGCDCPQWLADGDCPGGDDDGNFCNGTGGWTMEHPTTGREVDVVCGTCHGTGVYYDHSKPVAS